MFHYFITAYFHGSSSLLLQGLSFGHVVGHGHGAGTGLHRVHHLGARVVARLHGLGFFYHGVVVGAELGAKPSRGVHGVHLAATAVAGSWREFVHLQVSKLTWRHVSSWPRSALVAYGLEPLDPVGGRLVHNWAAAILKSARQVGSHLILARVIRGVVGAWRRGVVPLLGSEPLLARGPIGAS